jgi:lipopolysaccharide transport system ATP-binding protein
MTDTIIAVENLSKRYLVGHQSRHTYTALRDVLSRGAQNFARKSLDFARGRQIVQGDEVEEFWALREVSFEIKRGEVVGIVGRNGAGKTTLLKLLSRITAPTSGRIRLRGRVASLLEVGTGFHPELTGRENIFLNGAILGMTRSEIARKFDEIVAFAEVEYFLDVPVKHYSSGMYVRLAFAVAAHLEPEILLVDEVMAVGDAQFQKKCLGKIDTVSRKEGRTVLFVSHNMSAINNLCAKGIYLDLGRLQEVGEAKAVVSRYLTSAIDRDGEKNLTSEARSKHQKPVFFTAVSILNHKGEVSSQLEVTHSFYISLSYEYAHKTSGVELEIRIETCNGVAVFSSAHLLPDPNFHGGSNAQQSQIRYVEIPAMFLMPGQYFVTIAAHTPMVEVHDFHQQILGFEIVDDGTSWAKYGHYQQIGVVMVDLPWKTTLDFKGEDVAVSGRPTRAHSRVASLRTSAKESQ